jgi:hypothetical protein
VRTYPSHSSILYTLHPKRAGCEYPNDTSQREQFQASTTVCGHSIRFRSNTCGQIHVVELSEKALIGGANPRCQSRAEWIGITEIKIEKGAILSQCQHAVLVALGKELYTVLLTSILDRPKSMIVAFMDCFVTVMFTLVIGGTFANRSELSTNYDAKAERN